MNNQPLTRRSPPLRLTPPGNLSHGEFTAAKRRHPPGASQESRGWQHQSGSRPGDGRAAGIGQEPRGHGRRRVRARAPRQVSAGSSSATRLSPISSRVPAASARQPCQSSNPRIGGSLARSWRETPNSAKSRARLGLREREAEPPAELLPAWMTRKCTGGVRRTGVRTAVSGGDPREQSPPSRCGARGDTGAG